MAVTKFNGQNPPYTSDTFRKLVNSLADASGLLSIAGSVTSDVSNVYIPAFVVVQQGATGPGLVFGTSSQVTVAIPGGTLPVPCAVSVYSPSNLQQNDLVYRFPQSPTDFSDNEVVIAEWDGIEWRLAPRLAMGDALLDVLQEKADVGAAGPKNGLRTTLSGSTYTTTPGTLIDQQGKKVKFAQNFTYTPAAAAGTDPDWPRVDRVVYRRPRDSSTRVGRRRFLTGSTYDPTGTNILHNTLINASGSNPKVLVDASNKLHYFYAQGTAIRYAKYDTDRTTVLVADGALAISATSTTNFAVALDDSGNIHLVCVIGNNITWYKLSSVGAVVAGPVTIDAQANPCDNPKLAIPSGGTTVYFLYQCLLAAGNDQLFFQTRDLNANVVTAEKRITNTSTDLINPALSVSSDLMVYVAYEDLTNTRVYYLVTDTFGNTVTSPTLVSGTTKYGAATLTTGAKRPRIKFTDNGELFVVFLQDKGSSTYGLAVWHRDNVNADTAQMIDITGSGENFVDFAALVDPANNDLHLTLVQSGRVDAAQINGTTLVGTVAINGSTGGAAAPSVTKDIVGSLVHAWQYTNNNVRFAKTVGSASEANALSTAMVPLSDVLVARIHTSTGGTAILNYIPDAGVGISGTRFGTYGSPSIAWDGSTLTLGSGLQILDLRTNTVYTVNSGSFSMADGDALYVTLDGSTTTISAAVVSAYLLPVGEPIQCLGFAKGGKFNPHLLGAGGISILDANETDILGASLPTAIRTKLGITNETTLVSYGTPLTYISTGDDYPTAIGKLDRALQAKVGWPNYFVASEADLDAAITALASTGGVICVTGNFSITGTKTLPPGTVLTGRGIGGTPKITAATGGKIVLSSSGTQSRSEIRDIYIDASKTSGNLVEMSGDRGCLDKVKFVVTNTNALVCVYVSGNSNRIFNCIFDGVVTGTAVGIEYAAGSGNADYDTMTL